MKYTYTPHYRKLVVQRGNSNVGGQRLVAGTWVSNFAL